MLLDCVDDADSVYIFQPLNQEGRPEESAGEPYAESWGDKNQSLSRNGKYQVSDVSQSQLFCCCCYGANNGYVLLP